MAEKLEVGVTKEIINGDGETIQAKLTKVETHYLRYRQRKLGGKGRWSTKETDISRVAFWRAVRAASTQAA